MGFKEDIQKLAIQVIENKQYITNEETTKHSLIIPFIQVLGYDIFNPREVRPEFVSDFGKKKGTKVDYAIFKDDKPIIFIEAKPVNSNLTNFDSQLAYYFNAIHEVKLGIITNGVEYRFFTDLKAPNVMDEVPFFILSLANIEDSDINILTSFKKGNYDKDQLSKDAEVLAYTSTFNAALKTLFTTPSDEFIRFLIKNSNDIKVTANVIERFRPIVKKSINNAILDMVSTGLLQQENSLKTEPAPEGKADPAIQKTKAPVDDQESGSAQIVTTDEEIAAFQIVKGILERAGKDVSGLNYRDTINYFSINNRMVTKWLMRFVLHPDKKIIAFRCSPDVAKTLLKDFEIEQAPSHLGGGAKVLFNSIEDIMKMQQLIIAVFDDVNKN